MFRIEYRYHIDRPWFGLYDNPAAWDRTLMARDAYASHELLRIKATYVQN